MIRPVMALLGLVLAAPAFAQAPGAAPDKPPMPADAPAARVAAPLTSCDELSGMPVEQDWTDLDMPGLRYRQGRTKAEVAAIAEACREAAAAHPDEKRFPFRLGLALRHLKRTDEALAAFARARELGAVGGWDEAASTLIFGNGAEPQWSGRDAKAGMALLDDAIARHDQPVLAHTRALALLDGPAEVADKARGLEALRRLADAGYARAMIDLAERWLDADPSPERKDEALGLLRRAVDQGSGTAAERLARSLADQAEGHRLRTLGAARGSVAAMNALGYDYHYGRGTARDGEQARRHYEMAALRGDLTAQYNLGNLLSAGRLVRPDYDKARVWLDLAAARDHAAAVTALGMMYDHGRGVPIDRARARRLYERSAALGSAAGMSNLGYLFEHGRAATVDLPLARQWYEKAVAAGSADAMTNLASWYQAGKGGLDKDLRKAFDLLVQAAAKGSVQGTNNLAFAYWRGEGVARDDFKARALFREADDLGSREATHNLASMYEGGEGGPRDTDAARHYYRKAAEAGFANAMYRYARRVELDADLSDEEAEHAALAEQRLWLSRAVKAGDGNGVERLAEMLADGLGGEPAPAEALRLFERAAEKDDDVKQQLAERLRAGRGLTADPGAARRLLADLETPRAASALVAMMDAGEGGPKDPKAATDLLRGKVAGGEFRLAGAYARRLVEGRGAPRDPGAARAVLTIASLGEMLGPDAYQLGLMRERGQGGPVDLPGAVAAYRTAAERGSPEAQWRLAQALRSGRGTPADPAAARRLLASASTAAEPAAVVALVEMLDRGEGGPAEPAAAARTLLTAIMAGNAEALALAMRPGWRLSSATRAAFVEDLAPFGIESPKAARVSGPLVTAAMLPALGLAPAPKPRRRR